MRIYCGTLLDLYSIQVADDTNTLKDDPPTTFVQFKEKNSEGNSISLRINGEDLPRLAQAAVRAMSKRTAGPLERDALLQDLIKWANSTE